MTRINSFPTGDCHLDTLSIFGLVKIVSKDFVKRLTIKINGKTRRDKHSLAPKDLTKNFSVLMKCTNKFDCLVYEMFFICELRPTLNVQSDSIRAKVFN